MKNSNNEIISIIQESYNTMLEKGVRSNKKLKMIHSFIADKIKSKLSEFGEDIEVFSMRTDENSKEIAVAGAYYNKNVDIAVRYQNQDVSGISIKFITGNYKQNSINYFEHLLGETANLKTNGYKYASLYILPSYMPYYTNKKILKKIEEITDNDICKYLKINEERDLYHKPDIICIFMIDTGTKNFLQQNIGKVVSNKDLLSVNKVSQLNYDEYNFDSKVHKFLINHSNLDSFFNAFISLTKFNIYGK
jgi:hypothetical protein